MTKKTFKCRLCDADDFATPQSLGAHMRKEHPGQGLKSPKKKQSVVHEVQLTRYVEKPYVPANPSKALAEVMANASKNGKHKAKVSLAEAISVLNVKQQAYAEIIDILRTLEEEG